MELEAKRHTNSEKNIFQNSTTNLLNKYKMKSVLFAMMGLAALANAAEITHKVYFDIQIGNEDAGKKFF